MKFLADLHIHSKWSRATARDLDFENLHFWAQKKGLDLVATGDFTHPAWFAEISEKLREAEPGLFRLGDDFAAPVNQKVPPSCRAEVRFILSVEISNIYKKDGRTRKVHNLVFFPDFSAASRFNRRLEKIGNIKSDGRPILGLDSRNLLEIALECSTEAMFIPAHIWTPWFSLLGEKSGFDSVEECFGDMTRHITALETGLSSDPPMNRRISGLDPWVLVSNSDAHSAKKLGREANIFNTELSYHHIKEALETGDPEKFIGTIEFFPEEGKYHADGHRKCDVRLSPEESVRLSGRCPVCGDPLTLGVLYRVNELADRKNPSECPKKQVFESVIGLSAILAEIFSCGPDTGRVNAAYEAVLAAIGPEIGVLRNAGTAALEKLSIPLLAEAVDRVRKGRVELTPGYDGVYGEIGLFAPGERESLLGQAALFGPPAAVAPKRAGRKKAEKAGSDEIFQETGQPAPPDPRAPEITAPELNPEQLAAVEAPPAPLLIVAGPGTGKTRTLAHRAAHLIKNHGAAPESVLAVTFTNKAAGELRERISALLDEKSGVTVATFHALGLMLLTEAADGKPLSVISEADRLAFVEKALAACGVSDAKPADVAEKISRAKDRVWIPVAEPGFGEGLDPEVFSAYQGILARNRALDTDDLLYRTVRMLESKPDFREACQRRFRHVLVDEYQDVSASQYRLVRALCPVGASLAVIGDPDQAIYGFRGADVGYFSRFVHDYPEAQVVELSRNYRSSDNILRAASRIVEKGRLWKPQKPLESGIPGKSPIRLSCSASPAAEAETIVAAIENMVGGTSHFSVDSGRAGADRQNIGFGDFAVLVRIKALFGPLSEAFARSGIPFEIVDRKNLFDAPPNPAILSLLRFSEKAATDADMARIFRAAKRGVIEAATRALDDFAARLGISLFEALSEARRLPLPGLDLAAQRRLVALGTDLSIMSENMAGKFLEEKISAAGKFLGIADTKGGPESPLARLVEKARGFEGDAAAFLSCAALTRDEDTFDPAAQRVAVMTVHAAKGLEFEAVFVAGCEDGLFPLQMPGKPGDPGEERRLFYVAATRAKTALWFTASRRRLLFGDTGDRAVSPFLEEISDCLEDATPRGPAKRKPKGPTQMSFDFA